MEEDLWACGTFVNATKLVPELEKSIAASGKSRSDFAQDDEIHRTIANLKADGFALCSITGLLVCLDCKIGIPVQLNTSDDMVIEESDGSKAQVDSGEEMMIDESIGSKEQASTSDAMVIDEGIGGKEQLDTSDAKMGDESNANNANKLQMNTVAISGEAKSIGCNIQGKATIETVGDKGNSSALVKHILHYSKDISKASLVPVSRVSSLKNRSRQIWKLLLAINPSLSDIQKDRLAAKTVEKPLKWAKVHYYYMCPSCHWGTRGHTLLVAHFKNQHGESNAPRTASSPVPAQLLMRSESGGKVLVPVLEGPSKETWGSSSGGVRSPTGVQLPERSPRGQGQIQAQNQGRRGGPSTEQSINDSRASPKQSHLQLQGSTPRISNDRSTPISSPHCLSLAAIRSGSSSRHIPPQQPAVLTWPQNSWRQAFAAVPGRTRYSREQMLILAPPGTNTSLTSLFSSDVSAGAMSKKFGAL